MSDRPTPKKPSTPKEAVLAFRERHGLDQPETDRLMGFSSLGRTTRRWEAEGAPYYVSLLIAYADAYGLDLMRQMAAELELEET